LSSNIWVIQQLRETFPFDWTPRYLIIDRGGEYCEEVINRVKSFGIEPKRTSFQSPCRTVWRSAGVGVGAGI